MQSRLTFGWIFPEEYSPLSYRFLKWRSTEMTLPRPRERENGDGKRGYTDHASTPLASARLSRAAFERDVRPSGGDIPVFLSDQFVPLFQQKPGPAFACFRHLRTLSFPVSHLSPVSPALSALFPKKPGGVSPAVRPIPQLAYEIRSSLFSVGSRLPTVDCWPLASRLPRTDSRSPRIHSHQKQVHTPTEVTSK